MDLIEFLRARLDEDEATARAATPGPWYWEDGDDGFLRSRGEQFEGYPGDGTGPRLDEVVLSAHGMHTEGFIDWANDADPDHIARWDPARVLAEVEAKRRIIADAGQVPTISMRHVVKLLGQPYADHPDFDPAWSTAPVHQ